MGANVDEMLVDVFEANFFKGHHICCCMCQTVPDYQMNLHLFYQMRTHHSLIVSFSQRPQLIGVFEPSLFTSEVRNLVMKQLAWKQHTCSSNLGKIRLRLE